MQVRSSLSQSALHTAAPTPHPYKKLLKVHSGGSGPAMAAATRIWYPADTTNLRVSAKLESATPSTLPPGLTDDLAAALQSPDAAVHLQVRTAPALSIIIFCTAPPLCSSARVILAHVAVCAFFLQVKCAYNQHLIHQVPECAHDPALPFEVNTESEWSFPLLSIART